MDRVEGNSGTGLLLEGLPGSTGDRPFEGDGPLLHRESGHLLPLQRELLCLQEVLLGPHTLGEQGSISKEGLNLVRFDTGDHSLPQAALFRLEHGDLSFEFRQDGQGCLRA